MHHFTYKDNQLYCENVPIVEIAEAVGTPFYLYSFATLKRHYLAFTAAFEGVNKLVCYSAKANTNLAVLKLFATLGCGLDIVSGGELYRGIKAGFLPRKIVYSGVGKSDHEIDYALETGILMFNVESFDELEHINLRALRLKTQAPVAIRVNPDVDPKTHPYISTGLQKNKFGIDMQAAIEGYKMASRLDNIKVVGIDCHIGSQITEAEPFDNALKSLKALMNELKRLGITIRYLDMGGGLGITYGSETPPSLGEYAKAILADLDDPDLQLILEPGRVLVGNAGILVSRVLYRKLGVAKDFVIVDAGMNDLLRPTLYNAYHAIEPVEKSTENLIVADVVGPICESADFLAIERNMANVKRGDLLAVMSTGAYGYVMSSNYCSRPRVAEVMVRDDQFEVVKKRENYKDLVTGETLPAFLNDGR
ncbi:MAG: diaminopimelate decarboxylase [Desulfobacterales bacterium]|nr:MAG: diaminopimelate decarboxylase [Desulfobacterales bacterium]